MSVGAHHLDYTMNTLCVGLPLEEAKNVGYYMHFREEAPDNKQTQKVSVAYRLLYCTYTLTVCTSLLQQGITQSVDFLNTIEKDIPKGE